MMENIKKNKKDRKKKIEIKNVMSVKGRKKKKAKNYVIE